MTSRKLIAYALLAVLVFAIASWTWLRQRRARIEKARRHGPRED
jgi:hypothetical protein